MLTAGPRRAAVLGSPVTHSLSPVLHTAAYAALGLRGWSYEAHELSRDRLAGFVAGLGQEWAGLSLTMPLKEAALGVATEVTALAREVGAVNTLVRRADGSWLGDNTDVHGVRAALVAAGVERAGSAMVLGSGATARSVVAALADLHATRVTFAVRGQARPATLQQARSRGLAVEMCQLDEAAERTTGGDTARAGGCSLVVSTVPAGAADHLWAHAPAATARAVLLDVVYAGWPTALARDFANSGGQVVSGYDMLLHQAAEQVRLVTGQDPPLTAMRDALVAAVGPW